MNNWISGHISGSTDFQRDRLLLKTQRVVDRHEENVIFLEGGLPKGSPAMRLDGVCNGGRKGGIWWVGGGVGARVGRVWVSAGGQRHPQVDIRLLQDTLLSFLYTPIFSIVQNWRNSNVNWSRGMKEMGGVQGRVNDTMQWHWQKISLLPI